MCVLFYVIVIDNASTIICNNYPYTSDKYKQKKIISL